MKDYKVESLTYASGDIMGKTKPKYFQTREKAEEYAETLLSTHKRYNLDIYILHRDRQSKNPNFWSTVRYIVKISTDCVVTDYPE
jgi:hypothetical protein